MKFSALLLFLLCSLYIPPPKKNIPVRGVYGSPGNLWDKGISLSDLHVNAIFVHHKAISDLMMKHAKKEGQKVFAEFATLNGKDYVEQHPEAWAIDDNGEKVKAATWFMGVCPTEPGFKNYREAELRKLLNKYNIDGVWMDYLHYHAQFEDPEPILPETCFCNNCLQKFQTFSSLQLPAGSTKEKASWILKNHDTAWRNFRCSVVSGWVRDFRKIVKEEKPGGLLGIYHCPWNDEEFNGARRRILALDYDSLKNHADVFSPMVYHKRMGRSAEWVKENIEWFSGKLGDHALIWPIVQAYNDPGIISAAEFEKVLRYGSAANASGIMMFTTDAVAADDQKMQILKKVYAEMH
jgi:hypothetical protein